MKRFFKDGATIIDIVRGKVVNAQDVMFQLKKDGVEIEMAVLESLLYSRPISFVSNTTIENGYIKGPINGIGNISNKLQDVYLENDRCLVLDEGVVPLNEEQNNIVRAALMF